MTKTVSSEVSVVAYDVGQKTLDLLKVVKKAAADGIQLSDLTVVVQACIADLMPAMQELNQLTDEMKANRVAFERAVALFGVDMVEVLIS